MSFLKKTDEEDNLALLSGATFTTGLCCFITNISIIYQIIICITMSINYKCINNLYKISTINTNNIKEKKKVTNLKITNNQKLKAFYK